MLAVVILLLSMKKTRSLCATWRWEGSLEQFRI
jgi:hypothetical protein